MGKINRELPLEHLEAEKKAIRWLANRGFSLDEIRMFSWNNVDEFDKKVRATREVFFTKYDPKSGIMMSDKREKEIEIQIDDREVVEFFAHSRVYCHWCFLRERPLSWRKEKSLASLFSLCEIEEIVGGASCGKLCWLDALTPDDAFARIEVSGVDIDNTEHKEKAREEALID